MKDRFIKILPVFIKFISITLVFLLSVKGWPLDENSPFSQVLVKTTQSWDESTLPGYPEGQPEVTILRITIPAKTRVPMHKHPVINAAVVLKGELLVVSEKGEQLHLSAGDPIVELVNQWHYGENVGDTPVELLVFYAGVHGEALAIKKE